MQLRLNVAQEDNDSFRNGVHGRRTMVAPAMNWDITDRLSWLLQYERNESHRTPDRGIPGLNGRPADVPRDAVYSDVRRDYINDLAQSARSRFTWDVNDDWQVRQQLSLIDLSSQFDNTYVTEVTSKATVKRSRWQQDLQTRNLASNHSLSPRAGLVWNPIEEHAFYLSYSKSFMPNGGGVTGLNQIGDKNNTLDPELTRQYETGVKSDWLDGKLATTLSIYRLEMYNKRTKDPLDPSKILLTGLQRTDGIELSARAQLSDEVYLRGGIALQDAEMVEDSINQGNRPSSVSRLNGELFAGYQQGKLGWFGESGVTAVGDRFADNANTTVLPGYARVDARAGYRWQHWEAQFGMENLFDTHYYISATGASQIMPGSPRQVNLTTSYRF